MESSQQKVDAVRRNNEYQHEKRDDTALLNRVKVEERGPTDMFDYGEADDPC